MRLHHHDGADFTHIPASSARPATGRLARPGRTLRERPGLKAWVLGGLLGAGACGLLGSPIARAEEPAQAFLTALMEQRYYQTAIEYLDSLEKSGLAPDGFVEQIPFEKAIVLHQASKVTADSREKGKYLNDAEKLLADFLKAYPNVELSPRARKRLGDVLVDRAKLVLSDAERKPDTRPQAQKTARELFDRARELFVQTRDRLSTAIADGIRNKPDTSTPAGRRLADRLEDYKADFLQSRLLASVVMSEKADTYPVGSDERKKISESVIAELQETADKYARMGIGPYARFYQGKAQLEAGQLQAGIDSLEDVVERASKAAELRNLVLLSASLLGPTYLDPKIDKPNRAIEVIQPVVTVARPTEADSPDLAIVRYHLARAYQADSEKASTPRAKVGEYKRNARTLAFQSAKVRSPVQKPSQELLTALGGPDSSAADDQVATSFLDAAQRAADAVARLAQSTRTLASIKERLASASPAERQELQSQLDEAQNVFTTTAQTTLDNATRAVELAEPATSADEMNRIRYYLAYVSYVMERYPDAAAVSEFLMTRYPDSASAKATTGILLASFKSMYDMASDKDAALTALSDVAERIVSTYSGSPEADTALAQLIQIALTNKDVAKASAYLKRLPESSPQRGQIELVVGRTLWTDYLSGNRELARWRADGPPEGRSIEAEQKRLDEVKSEARAVLTQGVERMRKTGKADATFLIATLSLIRMETDLGNPDKAITLLEDDKVGPYTLVKADSPIVKATPAIRTETYRVALPAYLTAMAASDQPDALAEKAKEVMNRLEQQVGSTPQGRTELLQTYQVLAANLQSQLETTPPQDRPRLAAAFSGFLGQVASVADSFGNLNWAADTFLAIGRGVTPPGQDPGPDAVSAFDQAAGIYERILTEAESRGATFLDPKAVPLVRARLAEVRREQGKYDEALEIFTAILRDNSQVLSVQKEAALTIEALAKSKADPEMYLRAVAGMTRDDRKDLGGKPNPGFNKPIIWGWNTLSLRTSRYEQFRDLFHEARYHISRCYFESGKLRTDPADRDKNLKTAKKAMEMVYLQYPEMGGDAWRDRYDTLLREVQTELREPAKGLEAFTPAGPPASDTPVAAR